MAGPPPSPPIVFGPFLLDPDQARLTRDGAPVELAPKAFDLLVLLARRPGELVTKDELLDTIWGRRFITEGVIKTVVGQLREALGDDARQPRWIETVMRRGYRFIGEARATQPGTPSAAALPLPVPAAAPDDAVVGRGDTLARLAAAWQAARQGRHAMLFLAGEPGIGKSTVMAEFVRTLEGGNVASGQCVEHHHQGEPYLPVLEALHGLVRTDAAVLPLLRTTAPTWLAQMPWLIAEADRSALQRELAGVAQERMLRELGVLLERLADHQPLLLVLEDLHWSDAATVQLLDHLARRRGAARWMVLASYRPADVVAADHPFDTLRRELRLHRLCQDLHLEGFTVDQVHQYLVQRLGPDRDTGTGAGGAFAQALHAHTDGLPLFLACVVDELLEEGLLRRDPGGHWAWPRQAALPVPANLLDLTDKQMQRLPPEMRRLLAAAALAPAEFDHLALSTVLQMDAEQVHEQLDRLVRRRLWLRAAEPRVLPGGRMAARYGFGHALFRHAFAQRTGAAARTDLHRRLLQALEAQYGAMAPEIALDLALHAQHGAEPARAAHWYGVAAHVALQRIAPREALQLADQGLAQLAAVPPGPGRAAELPLLAARIPALTVTAGYGHPTTVQAVRQAFALVETHDPLPQTMPLWHATWWTLSNAGLHAPARTLMQRLEQAAQHDTHDAVVRVAALNLVAIAELHAHRLPEAHRHTTQSLQLQRSMAHAPRPPGFVQDLAIETLVHLQYLDEVCGRFHAAAAARAEIAQRISAGTDPLSESMALWYMAYAHYYRRDLPAAQALLARGQALMATRAALPGAGPYAMLAGGLLALAGDAPAGARQVLQALDAHFRPEHGTLMGSGAARVTAAQALLLHGDLEAAGRELDHAERLATDPELRLCWPELYRVRGAWHRARGDGLATAAVAWRESITRSRESEALLFELHAVRDWAQACEASGERDEACDLLAGVLRRIGDDAGARACPAVAEGYAQLARWGGLRG